MKSIFLILFFHMLTFSCLTAQNNSRLVFYDQNHKLIKERFGVADNDTTVRNGFYEQYNLNGCLVSKGFYQNNNKTGQWITRNDDARVISAGIIQNENITGYNLRYNGSGNISRLEFINNGHLQKAKQDLHKKLIDSLMTAIISLSGSSDTLFSKKTAYFNERVGNYKLLADDSLKYYIGLRLIGDMINFSSDVEDYLSYKKEILRISGKIQNNYKGKLYSAYQKRLSEVDSDLKIFYRSDSLQLRNKAGVAAIISFNRSEKNIDRLLAIDNELNNKLAVFGNNYKTNYPAIYSRQVTNLNKQADLYHSTDSLELKISIGNKLVTRLDSLDSWYSQFDMIDSYLLGSLPGVRNKINQNFPVLIKCYLDPFEKDITAYKTIDSAELKLAKGASVLKNLEFLGSSLEKMTSNEMLINTKYPSLRDNYLKDYPGIFKNDIKPIEAEISRNKADTLIARRLEEGAKIIAKMNALDSIYIEIQQIDKKLDESLPAVKSHYHDHFPGIYNKEILSFETKKNEYENIGTAVSRLATGKDLLDKLKSYGSDYIILRTQKSAIDSLFPPLKIKYKESYSDIYQAKIKEIGTGIDLYQACTMIADRIKQGEKILADIHLMTDNFGTLKEQENDISQRLQQSETGYKDAFPVVNKTEIKELKTKFKEYGKLETVEKKIAMGKIILDRLEIVEKILPELKEINSNIAVLLPDVQTKYKKFYSPLYKAEIVPFLLKFKEYDENGSVTTKVNLGKKVLEKLKYYNENFTRMKDQGDKLSAKFNEFNDLYKSRKDVKNIYKKGKMACNELLSAYNDEINIEKKMLMGEDIEFLLLKLISIAGKDNSVLNNDIKNAETPADVKRKLGL